MITSTLFSAPGSSLLRRALLLDALATGSSGLVAALASSLLAPWMGLPSPLILIVLGLVLVAYAGMIYRFAQAQPISRLGGWAAVILNTLWVIGSAALLLANWGPLTLPGKWIVVLVADLVGVFALLQFVGLRRMERIGRG